MLIKFGTSQIALKKSYAATESVGDHSIRYRSKGMLDIIKSLLLEF